MRKRLLILLLALLAGLTQAQSKNADEKNQKDTPAQPAKPRIEKPEAHEFVIKNFHTESGAVLPEARVVYGTYGKLNAARDNVVLLPSHYMATHVGYEWLIGPDRALDPAKLFLVATELFGNGHSS